MRLVKFWILVLIIGAVVFAFVYSQNQTPKVQTQEPQETESVEQGTGQETTSSDIDCPLEGSARNEQLRELNKLKNRSSIPEVQDFDTSVSLAKMLAPGDDRDRFSTDKAAEIIGYVADVKVGGVETCNCKAKDPDHRDTHIELVLNPMSYTNIQKVIIEVTPRMRNMMKAKGVDWSTRGLRDKILGRWIMVKGWMLFDIEHEHQAENTNPGGDRNWRGTCVELHPITEMQVIDRPR